MSNERLCGPQGQPCPTPDLCRLDCYFQTADLHTKTDTGHKIANGWKTDYMGKAAHDLPIGAYDMQDDWLQAFAAWWGSLSLWRKYLHAMVIILPLCLVAGLLTGFAN